MKNITLTVIVALFAVTSSQPALAALVSYMDITASTDMLDDGVFHIEQIADGITSDDEPYNGFASDGASSGTIRLDFTSPQDLRSFILHNDINVNFEGIADFRLDFYDASDIQIVTSFSTSYTGPQSQTAGEEYIFDSFVAGVSYVDLVIFNTNNIGVNQRIEIREVEFSVVPVPAAVWLFGSGLIGLIGIARRKKA